MELARRSKDFERKKKNTIGERRLRRLIRIEVVRIEKIKQGE